MDESTLEHIDPKYHDQFRKNVDLAPILEGARKKVQKWADRIIVGGFYEKPVEPTREESEVWEDTDGTEWTMVDGNKVKTKTLILQQIKMPYWCPKCGGILDSKLHEKFWRIRGTCHNCVIKYEHKIRVEGLWPAYERNLMRNNERAWLKDQMAAHLDYIENFRTPQSHYGDGRWEEIADKTLFEGMFDKLRADIKFIEDRMDAIDKEEEEDADEQQRLADWRRDNPWTTTPEGE